MTKPLLEVSNLTVGFEVDGKMVHVIDDFSFELEKGKTLGLVGESGSGKTMTALAIMGLLPRGANILSGKIIFNGKDLLSLHEKERRLYRGRHIAMIFQEPMSSLNPVMRVGAQIAEVIQFHFKASQDEAMNRTYELLEQVGIASPKLRAMSYPHELSGGMRQRVMIAMALAGKPDLILADEPTTALDVTIQAQILELLSQLGSERGVSMILVTHDLGVVAEHSDDMCVMYAGLVAEYGRTEDIFTSPMHPYTRGLIQSLPGYQSNSTLSRLPSIRGAVPGLKDMPKGCRFAPRCEKSDESCVLSRPPLVKQNNRVHACIHPYQEN